jgi:phosphoserine aminotransferase
MSTVEILTSQRLAALDATKEGPPPRTGNPFFGVGPITDGAADEVESRMLRFGLEAWIENNYRKLDDKGRDIGPFTAGELSRSMHRGYPADKILLDMMREIHRYFEFPKANKMAVGLGGGHSGFSVCMMHLMNAQDEGQHVYVDTARPESNSNSFGGFFRQSWATQIIELQRHGGGDEDRLHFAVEEGAIPPATELQRMRIKLFVGVGHETTGATCYSTEDIENLLQWIDSNPAEHNAVLDVTSLLGAMPWSEELSREVMTKCCMFTPFQKAIGGISGYYIASFTPQALALIEANQRSPSWAIPRQFKLAAPANAARPLTGERSVMIGPFYDPAQDKMLGGVINTYSTLAFAETTFGLLRSERLLGSASELNARSMKNRDAVDEWVAQQDLFELTVSEADRRGCAVTLLKVRDADVNDPAIHARIVARSKQLLGYEGFTHPNGRHETGLDVARYVNAFPGTPGDYRAWIGGIRAPESVIALLQNLRYAYLKAKALVLEEELAAQGVVFEAAPTLTPAAEADESGKFQALRETSEMRAAVWGALAVTRDPERRRELMHRYSAVIEGHHE